MQQATVTANRCERAGTPEEKARGGKRKQHEQDHWQ
jgi:hypothetical protein